MKALKVVSQIVGGLCLIVAALMFSTEETGVTVISLISGVLLLIGASKLPNPTSSGNRASVSEALKKAENALQLKNLQMEIKAEKIAATWKNPFRQSMQMPAEQYVNKDFPIPPGFRAYLEDYLLENGRVEDLQKFFGRNDALGYILAGEDYRMRAMFFAYAVDCERHVKTMGDIRKARNLGKYEQFADFVGEHEELHRSLYGRPTCDYWSPSHNTKIYKAAAVWFP